MRRAGLLVAVWKEKLNYSQSVAAARGIVQLTLGEDWPFEVAIAPNPFCCVGTAEAIAGSPVSLCAQNVLWEAASGSYIGETTESMLREVNCKYVIVGHSERRLHFGETDEMITNRALNALRVGICPIICIGDTAKHREEGVSRQVIMEQLRIFLEALSDNTKPSDLMIAYEPVWAISTWRSGQPLPSGSEVQDLHAILRALIGEIRNDRFAEGISLLYGGSVSPENSEDYLSQPDVEGALVGGASKSPGSFVQTLRGAKRGLELKRSRTTAGGQPQ